jgi:hypothetical protein
MDRLAPAGSPVGDAVAQIGAAYAALRRAVGKSVLKATAAEVVAVCSGGWLLAVAAPVVAGLRFNISPHL